MRMMLIFILLCLLVPFAESNTEGCGTTYKCYAPEMCIPYHLKTSIGTSEVTEVKTDVKIIDDCAGLIKFYQYQEHWTYVSIESFKDKVTKIVFRQKDRQGTKSEFTCEKIDDDHAQGQYKNLPSNPGRAKPTIKCEFDVILGVSEKVFGKGSGDDKITMHITTEGTTEDTKVAKFSITIRQCDPSDFKFVHGKKQNKIYKEIKWNAGKYFCDDEDIFKREFRRDGSDEEEYEAVTSLDCDEKMFKINDYDANDFWVYIRCVAEAHFFCDYEPMHSGQGAKLAYEAPIRAQLKPGSLKCPNGYPYLYIDKQKPILNPTIECLDYGTHQYWTVKDSTHLTRDKPKVHCSKTVECHVMNSFPTSAPKNGHFGPDHTPKCKGTGELQLNNKKVEVLCDGTTGVFKYKIEGEAEQPVTKDTEFTCYTEPSNKQEVEAQNQQNVETIKRSIYIIIPAAIVAIVVAVAIGVCVTRRNMAKEKKKVEDAMAAGYYKFCVKDVDKKAERKKKQKLKNGASSDSNPSSDLLLPVNWSKSMMNLQYTGLKTCFEPKELSKEDAFPIGITFEEVPDAVAGIPGRFMGNSNIQKSESDELESLEIAMLEFYKVVLDTHKTVKEEMLKQKEEEKNKKLKK